VALIDLGCLWMQHEPSLKQDLNVLDLIESGFCEGLISISGQGWWLAVRRIISAMVGFPWPVDRFH